MSPQQRQSRLATLLRAGCAAVFLGAAAGCVDADAELGIVRDGSGSVRIQVLVHDDARDRVAQLAWLADRLGISNEHPLGALLRMVHEAGGDPLHAFYRREVLEAWGRDLGPDVRLVRVQRLRRGDAENGFDALYVFPDIRRVAWTGEPVEGMAPDRVSFDFQDGPRPILRIIGQPARPAVDDERNRRAAGLMARLGARLGGARAASEALRGLRLRLTVRAEEPVWAPRAAYPLHASTLLLAEIRGDAMSGDDLLRLIRVKDLADLEELAALRPAGLRLQNPREPLFIVFPPAPGP